jgi:hypothetical protein
MAVSEWSLVVIVGMFMSVCGSEHFARPHSCAATVHNYEEREKPLNACTLCGFRRRDSNRTAIQRADIRHLSEASVSRRVQSPGHRSSRLQADRRAGRRTHVGRVVGRRGSVFRFTVRKSHKAIKKRSSNNDRATRPKSIYSDRSRN